MAARSLPKAVVVDDETLTTGARLLAERGPSRVGLRAKRDRCGIDPRAATTGEG